MRDLKERHVEMRGDKEGIPIGIRIPDSQLSGDSNIDFYLRRNWIFKREDRGWWRRRRRRRCTCICLHWNNCLASFLSLVLRRGWITKTLIIERRTSSPCYLHSVLCKRKESSSFWTSLYWQPHWELTFIQCNPFLGNLAFSHMAGVNKFTFIKTKALPVFTPGESTVKAVAEDKGPAFWV